MGERREHIIVNHTPKFHPDLSSEVIEMGSIPRYPLLSHTLLHIKNYLFIVGIGPIFDNELIFIFRYVPFFVRSIEDRYKYYRINIRYTSVFDFFTISFITMLAMFRCIHRNIFYFVGIGLVLYTKPRSAGYTNQSTVV